MCTSSGMHIHAYVHTVKLVFLFPVIFFDRFVHNIDEDMGFVTVIVSSNGAHLRPVNFRLGIQTMSSTADGIYMYIIT